MKISVQTAMYVADSSYKRLEELLRRVAPEERRNVALEWRTEFRKHLNNPNKEAAKAAEEEFFKKW